ncbi:MAG TPA: hypothetical protein VF951_09245 [Streptosporangiaceae bacterium]
MALLHPGDKFPALTLTVPGGGTLQLPDSLAGHFGVVLFFRGGRHRTPGARRRRRLHPLPASARRRRDCLNTAATQDRRQSS